jgi:hypothetical protein
MKRSAAAFVFVVVSAFPQAIAKRERQISPPPGPPSDKNHPRQYAASTQTLCRGSPAIATTAAAAAHATESSADGAQQGQRIGRSVPGRPLHSLNAVAGQPSSLPSLQRWCSEVGAEPRHFALIE